MILRKKRVFFQNFLSTLDALVRFGCSYKAFVRVKTTFDVPHRNELQTCNQTGNTRYNFKHTFESITQSLKNVKTKWTKNKNTQTQTLGYNICAYGLQRVKIALKTKMLKLNSKWPNNTKTQFIRWWRHCKETGYISIFLNDPTTSRTRSPPALRGFPTKEAVVRFWLTEMSREPSSDSSEELAPLVREDVEAVMRLLLLLNVM